MIDIVGCSASRAALTARLREQLSLTERALLRGDNVLLPAPSALAINLAAMGSTLTTLSPAASSALEASL